MEFRIAFQTLYQKALDLKTQGRPAEAAALDAEAAEILQQVRREIEQAPEDPETADRLLFLAEREWPLLGDHEDVLSKIQQAVALREKQCGPNHALTAEAVAKLAEFHFLAGRFGEAETFYRRAVPNCAEALGGLAQTLAAVGRVEEADTYFAQAIAQSPEDAQGKRALYFLLIYRAEGLEKMGRHPEAQGLRHSAAALLPKGNPGELGYHV